MNFKNIDFDKKGTYESQLTEIKVTDTAVIIENKITEDRVVVISKDAKFERVQEPVDFMTAVASGERIKLVDSNMDYMCLDDALIYLSEYVRDLSQDAILNGKWYIEED